MTIKVNGKLQTTEARTVADLLAEMQAPCSGVAVALNGQVVRRAEQPLTLLHEHDELEIIYAVQGG